MRILQWLAADENIKEGKFGGEIYREVHDDTDEWFSICGL